MRAIASVACVVIAATSLPAQQRSAAALSVKQLADSVAESGSNLARTQRLVYWVNRTFSWSATDYQKRTPAEIIARREGNCAELASVLDLLLDSLSIPSRWIRELNVEPISDSRQKNAESRIAVYGNRMSVFGRQHNDHVWLEVYDDSTRTWFPADPAYGVVGLSEWLPARLAFTSRPRPRVLAVVPIAAEMLVPFTVVLLPERTAKPAENRSEYYLVDGFNQLYDGRLAKLPTWSEWVSGIRELSAHGMAAFAGDENLHQQATAISRIKAIYDRLGSEAAAAGLLRFP